VLKMILIGLAAAIVVFVMIVALRPSAFRIARSATMAAPPAAPFAQVNDFHNWAGWNPFQKADPAATLTYSGPSSGPGAGLAWSGNREVGEGRMTITETRPNELVRIKLEFLKPFAATNVAEFTFEPRGSETAVTWSMAGENNFMARGMGLFMDFDKLIGDQFTKGLADMKGIVESGARS